MTKTETRFFEFRQNNSGGRWVGPKTVFVEALSAQHANERALEFGLWFHMSASECECCGPRWWKQWETEPGLEEVPFFPEEGTVFHLFVE